MVKVLVIDDYQEHVDTLVETLRLYGAVADGTGDAEAGLAMLCSERYDLLICDGLLAGKRAWKLAHQYCQITSDAADILLPNVNKPYMVALTGYGSTLQRRLCEECGYDEYVTKPIELCTLLGWVTKAREKAEGRV